MLELISLKPRNPAYRIKKRASCSSSLSIIHFHAHQGEIIMNALIVYYSLTGKTRKLAEKLAEQLECDIEKIPMFGATKLSPDQYDLVVVGTPIWLYAPAFPAARFLSKNKDKLRKVAFFCTYDTTIGNSFENMARKCGKAPADVLKLMGAEVGTEKGDREVKRFLENIQK